MTQTLRPVSVSGDGTTRVPEDILRSYNPLTATPAELTSPLISRGRLLYRGDPWNGFPSLGQHFQGDGLARTPPFYDSRSGGRLVEGIGKEANGYGSADDGAGIYYRRDRNVTDCYWTFSGVFEIRAEVPGASTDFTLYFDTQNWDNTGRQYPKITYTSGSDNKWKISNAPNPFISVPGLNGRMLGDNEDKRGGLYVAVGWYMAEDITQCHYGFIQVGSQIVDLRTLMDGGTPRGKLNNPETPQTTFAFAGGANVGIGASTPLPGKKGGFCINRMEVTVGDRLVPVA